MTLQNLTFTLMILKNRLLLVKVLCELFARKYCFTFIEAQTDGLGAIYYDGANNREVDISLCFKITLIVLEVVLLILFSYLFERWFVAVINKQ